jgi:hypothetical protein
MTSNAAPEWSARLKRFWIVVFLLVLLPFAIAYWAVLSAPLPTRGDLVQDWASAREYLAGRDLYGDLGEAVQRHTGLACHGLAVNAHPPASVLLVLPFAPLDFETAYRVWTLLWLATLPLTLGLVLRQPEVGLSGWAILPAGALLLASRPLEEEIAQGQLHLCLLLLLTLAWIAQRRGRLALSGGVIGAAAAVKLIPAFLVVYFAAGRRWRALLGAALGFGLVNGVALALFGWEAFATFAREVVPRSAMNDESWRNLSVRGFFHKLFDADTFAVPLWSSPGLARVGPWVVSAAVAATVAWRAASADSGRPATGRTRSPWSACCSPRRSSGSTTCSSWACPCSCSGRRRAGCASAGSSSWRRP